MATFIRGKKLIQLHVIDLRTELGKRGLDKSGLNSVLVERLERSILEEAGVLEEFPEDSEVDVV